jgi:hypothetical protein
MNLLRADWDVRSLWTMLPLLSKLTLLFLLLVAAVTLISAFKYLHLHSRRKISESGHSFANLRQFHLFALYSFGACLADHLFAAVNAIERSRSSLQAEGVEAFGPLAWLAFVGFLLLLFSHSVQWLASTRLDSVSRRTQ